jgi:carbamoyltransferase
MIILGVHHGHDSSAAIVVDGKVVADAQEERFNRNKHSSDVPYNSILYCLEEAGLSDINEVDKISLSWSNMTAELRALFGFKSRELIRHKIIRFAAKQIYGRDLDQNKYKTPLYYNDLKVVDESKIITNNHHLAHAASAYFTSKSNDKCLIFTIDGSGDGICTGIYMGEGSSINKLDSHYKEGAIGWPYSVVTEGLHWIHGDGEGKTMGLAPYGDYNKCKGVLDRYFPTFDGCNLIKKSELGNVFYWNEKGAVQYHFDEASSVEKIILKYGKENVAAEAQRKLEDNVLSLVKGWIDKTGVNRVAFAGGVMLNVKLNQRIWYKLSSEIKEQHIYPNPSDAGLAVGAALLEYYRHSQFSGSFFNHLFLGPGYGNEEIKNVLDVRKLNYEYVKDPSSIAAELLADNKIIAWFQGKMESGPRALGARSILMSPIKSENKDIINKFVKFREGFRPFCPSLLYEKRDEYLEDSRDELYMITSFDVLEHKKNCIPAVVHVDGTVRPQLVQRETNSRYWKLIKEFGDRTGEYVVLNSSFNIMGEPIVNNPKEAVRCFYDSGIDALLIGNYLLRK